MRLTEITELQHGDQFRAHIFGGLAALAMSTALPTDSLAAKRLVFGGGPYDQSVLIGFAVGTASFDLAGTGLSSTRYLRIVGHGNTANDWNSITEARPLRDVTLDD